MRHKYFKEESPWEENIYCTGNTYSTKVSSKSFKVFLNITNKSFFQIKYYTIYLIIIHSRILLLANSKY